MKSKEMKFKLSVACEKDLSEIWNLKQTDDAHMQKKVYESWHFSYPIQVKISKMILEREKSTLVSSRSGFNKRRNKKFLCSARHNDWNVIKIDPIDPTYKAERVKRCIKCESQRL